MRFVTMIAALAITASAQAADVDCTSKPIAFSRAQKVALPELKVLEKQGYILVAINLSATCPAVVELISYNRFTNAKATVAVYRDAKGAELVSGPSITPYY